MRALLSEGSALWLSHEKGRISPAKNSRAIEPKLNRHNGAALARFCDLAGPTVSMKVYASARIAPSHSV